MLNFIKSDYILKNITNYLDTKIKLKIFKFNKTLLKKIGINKDDFAKYYSEKLLQFDSKRLSRRSIDDNILRFLDLSKIIIKDDDYILNLSDNYIQNLVAFEKGGFLYRYDFLYLCNNLISDIRSLEKDDFKNLLRLILSMNKISNINILEKAKLYKLKALNLSNNEISDISILEKANLPKLNELYLHGNKIVDITVLKNVKFERLDILDLSKNKISDITVFKNLSNFTNLNYLNLSKNLITDISVFIHWIENYNNMIRKEDSHNLDNNLIFSNNNEKVFKRILGGLELLDLNQNEFTFNYYYKKLSFDEEFFGLKYDRTIVIIDDNKYKF